MPLPKDPQKAELWRQHQRAAQTGKSRNKGENNPFYGRKHTAEEKRKISEAITGERNPNFGKKQPQSVKDAISRANKGKSSSFKGRHHSSKTKQATSRRSKGNTYRLGKRCSDMQRLNVSNGTKIRTPRGSKNPRWKGGISPQNQAERYSFNYKEWRQAVFHRDHYTCQNCGYTGGHILIAHHIKPFSTHPELRLAIDNGITLCKPCHQAITSRHDSPQMKLLLPPQS